jgi:hypothetical protein
MSSGVWRVREGALLATDAHAELRAMRARQCALTALASSQ